MERFITPSSSIELQNFKSGINLSEYASSKGYQLDKNSSSKCSIVMRHPTNDDKIIIAKGMDNHWVYFSTRSNNDSGTIIDFVQNRDGKNLAEVREELRPWVGTSKPIIEKELFQSKIEPTQKDRQGVLQNYIRFEELENPEYLNSRGISNTTLQDPRFVGMIKQDQRGNMIFPHYDKQGLAGYEMKNKGFTGFAKGGEKAVWHSRIGQTDNKLVIVESAIDALSYHQQYGDSKTRYMSIAGQFNDAQKRVILPAAMKKMSQGSIIVMAFDKDRDGDRFAQELKEIAPADITVRRHTPKIGKDWNEQLQAIQNQKNQELAKAAQGIGMGIGK